MVKFRLIQFFVLALGFTTEAQALLSQTASDLMILEDTLRTKFDETSNLRKDALPMLVATPTHLWKESRDDFAASVQDVLTRVFTDSGNIINCPDCETWRLNVREDNKIIINNGELSLSELGVLKRTPAYQNAKSVAFVRETSSGVEFKVVSIADGRVLHQSLSDSSKTLNQIRPYMNYAAERERRLRAESLAYVFVNIGLWPSGLFQMEFIEQWGARNQHLSGVGISLVNPVLALGGIYHYTFSGLRRLNVSGGLYYPLINAISSAISNDSNLSEQFVLQLSAQYLISNSYAVFASVGTEGGVSIGFTFFNPLLFPVVL